MKALSALKRGRTTRAQAVVLIEQIHKHYKQQHVKKLYFWAK